MVVHRLFAYKVTALYLGAVNAERLQCIFHKLAVTLVLLIVSVTLGVVRSCIEAPAVVEMVVYKQLVVLLTVVVGLVIVVMRLAVGIGIHISATVVTAPILLHLLLCGIVPGVVGLLLARECDEAHGGVVTVVCALQVV